MPCGRYHAINYTARATRLPLEPGAPRFSDFAAPGSDDMWRGAAWIVEKLCTPRTSQPAGRG